SSATNTTAQRRRRGSTLTRIVMLDLSFALRLRLGPLHRRALRKVRMPRRKARARLPPVKVGESEVEIVERTANGNLPEIDGCRAGIAQHSDVAVEPVEPAADLFHLTRDPVRPTQGLRPHGPLGA